MERTVTGYFDYVENLIERENTFTMEALANSVDKFLNFNEVKVLEEKGKISHNKAVEKANLEYDQFSKTQKSFQILTKRLRNFKLS